MRIWIIRMRLGAWEDICKKNLGLLISVGNKKVGKNILVSRKKGVIFDLHKGFKEGRSDCSLAYVYDSIPVSCSGGGYCHLRVAVIC